MSAATKRRIVEKEVAESLIELHENQIVARIVAGRGNNLHEIELDGGDTCLASMPTKFRRTVWVKRGDYVVCVPIDEGNKVKMEIAHVLTRTDVLHNVEQARFPLFFINTDSTLSRHTNASCNDDEPLVNNIDKDLLPPSESDDSNSDEEQICNPNRTRATFQ